MRDPLYSKIVEALGRSNLNAKTFELCMGILLRKDIPGLVPVVGGDDEGMDGAFPDPDGEPCPLVCTTAADVIGNLTKSLHRHLLSGRSSRKVVVATSQALTPPRRKNLEVRARDMGFTLVQTYDRAILASLLYHDSHWRKDLLHISGAPSALTAVPQNRRRLATGRAPIGRDRELAWLLDTGTDSVLVGQPGSGKTFLLYHLIQEKGWAALFVNPAIDVGAMAEDVRDRRPKVVIFDDAHAHRNKLKFLVALRSEVAADFTILATTWPTDDKDRIVEILGGTARVLQLEPLSRKQIQCVIEQVGVRGPDTLLRELIDQAHNRPGLATVLAYLILAGKQAEVLAGLALQRSLLRDFGDKVQLLLATLSLGGDRGMRLLDVVEYLGISLDRARRIALDLASAGVLTTFEDGRLAVWPRTLRWRMVATVFFGALKLPYASLLEKAPSRTEAIATLIYAKGRCEAGIPFQSLCDLVANDGVRKLWQLLARLGPHEARWALDHYPGDSLNVAEAALEHAPTEAIEALLLRAMGRTAEDRSNLDPWNILSAWAKDMLDDPDEELRRRAHLAGVALTFLVRNRGVGQRAVFLALDPERRGASSDPAIGDTLHLRWSLLSEPQLRLIEAIWDGVKGLISDIDDGAWEQVEHTLQAWARPEAVVPGEVPQAVKCFMQGFAANLISHLAPFCAARPGRIAQLHRLASACEAEIAIELDPVFDLLYPSMQELRVSLGAEIEARQDRLKDLAEQWSARDPADVAAQLDSYERESTAVRGRIAPHLVRHLAERVADLEAWITAFRERRLFSLGALFSEHIVQGRREGWEEHLAACLAHSELRFHAAEQIFTLADPPGALLEAALDAAAQQPRLVDTLALRRQIASGTLVRLLRDPRWELALAAALGEWRSDPEGGRVREELRADWRDAILAAKSAEYADAEDDFGREFRLREILKSDPALAFDWLRRRLADSDLPYHLDPEGAFAVAARSIPLAHKEELLAVLGELPIPGSLVRHLVGSDVGLYERFLARTDPGEHWFAPLAGAPDAEWIALARIALAAGRRPEAVAGAAFTGGAAGYGRRPFAAWEPGFEALSRHPEAGLRAVGNCGLAILGEWNDLAAKEQRRDDLQGIGPG